MRAATRSDAAGFREFLDRIEEPGARPILPPSATGAALEAASAGIPVISMAEYRARLQTGA